MGGHSKKAGKGGGNTHRGKHLEARKKLSKDPGVPNLKALGQKLAQTAQKKTHSLSSIRGVRTSAYSSHSNENIFSSREETTEDQVMRNRSEMTRLALRSTERAHQFDLPQQLYNEEATGEDNGEISGFFDQKEKSMRRFFKEFQQVVENCDVILQVVDARDPLGCRLTEAERTIQSLHGNSKHIVVVLNKVDLLPSKEVTDAWIRYFEEQEQMTCIPFSATAKGAEGQHCINEMFRRLRLLARNDENSARKAIVVGVIGYPNVGKSSIINALKRKNVVGVGNMPGFTTGNTEVGLRSDIRVLDCPGVVAPGEDTGDVVLRNAVKVSDIVNPFLPVERLLERCATAVVQEGAEEDKVWSGLVHPLALFYNIGSFAAHDAMEFIRLVGLRRGRLLKGGEVNEEETARMILHDWNDGRIPYFTLPPTVHEFGLDTLAEDQGLEAPQLVESGAAGLTVDGLPTFHLVTSRLMEGRIGKKGFTRRD